MAWKKAITDHPQSWETGTLAPENIFSVATVTGAIANTAIQGYYSLPMGTKLSKISVSFSALTAVAGTNKFNIVYNSPTQLNGAQTYTQGNIAGQDNSNIEGYPTNPATAAQSVFSADILITNAAGNAYSATTANGTTGCGVPGTGWLSTTTSGGMGIFVPDSYDAFYPLGGVFTLRFVIAAGSTLANFNVTAVLEPRPITPTYVTQTINNPTILPGTSF